MFKTEFQSAIIHRTNSLLSTGYSREEIYSALPFPPPGGSLNPEIIPPHLQPWQADSLPLSQLGSPVTQLSGLEFFRKCSEIERKLGDAVVCIAKTY